MGTWGTGLYSDDFACDVRDDYKDVLGDGIAEPEATKYIIELCKSEITDPDLGPIFWLALADTQWNLGRLQERVKKEALQIIEDGTDISRWISDQKLVAKRKKVLERLRIKLGSPQPKEKKVKKRYVSKTDWKLGDVYSFRLLSGNLILLHVIGFHQDKGGRGPVCEILEWYGKTLPNKKAIRKMDYKFANEPTQHLSQFLFASLNKNDFQDERVTLVVNGIKPKQKKGGYGVIFWRSADDDFEKFFRLK